MVYLCTGKVSYLQGKTLQVDGLATNFVGYSVESTATLQVTLQRVQQLYITSYPVGYKQMLPD